MKIQEKKIKTEQKVQIIRAEAELRVKKMVVRDNLLDEIKAEAVKALQDATKDQLKYKANLTDLIVQGLIKMNEPNVDVIVRECDKALAESVLGDAAAKYVDVIKTTTGQTATVKLAVNPGGKCLPPPADGSGKKSCAGGVKLNASGGRVVCDNTLDSRLETAFAELMPEIRSILFTQRV
jgi:V-type H+-transporting ATPase subunit E